MRALYLLLAVYIISLSVYPCYDIDYPETGTPTYSATLEGDAHDDACGTCSPFCVSPCCSVHLSCPGSIFTVTVVNQLSPTIVTYSEANFPKVYCSIWQPPKIA